MTPGREGTSALGDLLAHRPLLVCALCALLFNFANAPLLPLVGQKLTATHRGLATAMMSACIMAMPETAWHGDPRYPKAHPA